MRGALVLPLLAVLAGFRVGAATLPAKNVAEPALGEAISLAEYRARLQGIATALERGDPRAREAAGRLLGVRNIRFGGAPPAGPRTLSPDLSVLAPLARGVQGPALRLAAVRLRTLLASLPEAETTAPEPADPVDPPDPALLARLSARAALADLPRGGGLPRIRDDGWVKTVTDFFEPTRRWVADHLDRLWRWLVKLFTHKGKQGASEVDLPRLVTVLVLALAAVLGALGLLALKRRRAPAALLPAPAAAAPPPASDDDPLSRRAGEWEIYARELAAAGRHREAVRAWYHAVLVALYQRGTLHHRKGRTNWEYVATIPPQESWRPDFAALTRSFEREWYGSDQSSREALDEVAAAAEGLLGALPLGERRVGLGARAGADSREGEAA
jgi:hypothetical protein